MTAPPSIRVLTAADVTAYRTLRLQALGDHPDAFGASLEDEAAHSLEDMARRLDAGPGNCVFGAFAGGALIGTAGFVVPDRSAKSRHKGLLVGVHVSGDYRGRGMGRALVGAVIDHARTHVVLLQAAVGIDNAAALRLYESLGFQRYGLERKALRIDGRDIDEALIVLDFDGPVAPGRD